MARVSFAVMMVAAVLMASSVSALTCVLLHGIGQEGPGVKTNNKLKDNNYVRKSLPAYWGDLDVRMRKAGCLDVFVYWTDTVTRGWNNADLQTEYCGLLAEVNADVVFAHSMGGMVLAAGIANKATGCERIGQAANAKTHWYSLQTPFGGSVAADALAQVCPNEYAAVFLGKGCAKDANGKIKISGAYSSLQTTAVTGALKTTAAAYESGNMCGLLTDNTAAKIDRNELAVTVDKAATALGLTTIKALVSVLQPNQPDWQANNKPTQSGSKVIPATGTDGMVSWSSCRTHDVNAYQKDPGHTYYAMEGNHGDGRCTFGEDPNNQNYQPCTYVANMIKRTAGLKKAAAAKFAQIFDEDEAEEAEADEFDAENDNENEDESEADADAEADDEAEGDAEADAEDAEEMEDFVADEQEAERYEFADA